MQFNLYYLKFIMRTLLLSGLMMVFLMEMLLANSVNAQLLKKKITISVTGKNTAEALRQLEGQQVFIAYDPGKLNLDQKATRSRKFVNSTVEDVLKHILSGTGVGYEEVGSYIMLQPLVVQQPGRVSGRIIDERGLGLPNATIRIVELNRNAQSGIDGSYSLRIPAGKYTLEVSYISYQTQRISNVQVQSGDITALNIAMVAQTAQLAEAVVNTSFKKASVAGLYAAQKNAASVTDGISAEQIARTPDNDMGQVLKRVTGLTTVDNKNVVVRGMSERYNQAMLDGVVIPSTSMNKRNFSFDIIPTEMVSNVVVNKTATPDMSSEFSGGQVSVNTLDIPTQNFTSIQVGTGTNSQTLGKDFYHLGKRYNSEYFGFYNSSAKLPDGMTPWYWTSGVEVPPPGIPGQTDDLTLLPNDPRPYSSLDAIAQSRRLSAEPLKLNKYKGMPNQNYRFSLGRVYDLENGMKLGFAASANIRNEQNIVKFNNVRSSNRGGFHFIDSVGLGQNGAGTSYRFNSSSGLVANIGLQGKDFKVSSKNMYARTYNSNYNEATRLNYEDLEQAPFREQYQLPEAMSLQQHQLNVEYLLPWSVKMEAMGAVNKIEQQILDERKLRYTLTTIVDGKPYFQTPNLRLPSQIGGDNLSRDSRMWTNVDETDYNWKFDFSKRFAAGANISTLVKLGYQGWSKNRSLDVFRMLPAAARGSNIEQPYEVILDPQNIGKEINQAYYWAENINGRIFNGDMKNHAGYLMADQKLWEKLRLVYGVRMEYYRLNNQQAEYWDRTSGVVNKYLEYRDLVEDKNWRALPSVNATYSVTNDFNVRASYSRTAIRPDFRETSFFGFYDYELDANISGGLMTSSLVDNADIRFEWYPGAGEIISLTGYYKYLDKPVELVMDPRLNTQKYFVFVNMESARNLGVEMEVRKNLSFVSSQEWLSKFYVYANGTLLKSSVKTLSPWYVDANQDNALVQAKGADQDRPLMGQSPWLLNLGLSYWGDYYGATASYNQRGPRTNLANTSPNLVEYELAPRQLDFQIYARLFKKKAEIKFNMANLLNEWTRFYTNTEAYEMITPGKEADGFRLVKGDNKYNKGDGDTITYRKQDGRRFNLSFTYNF